MTSDFNLLKCRRNSLSVEGTDPPIITERIADDAAAGSTEEYDSDLDELLSIDENPIE